MATEKQTDDRDRPIQDAAMQVEQLAIEAQAMLEALSEGWLWKLLTIKPSPKE
jgi:hypothetical protein